MRGTRTFIILLYTKFCNHCVPAAHSAASRFLLIEDILSLRARSNLFASTISKFPTQVLLPVFPSVMLMTLGWMLQVIDLLPNAWVKIDLILILIPSFVPELTTRLVMGLEVYTSIPFPDRTQVRNHEPISCLFTSSFPLFFKTMLICGLDH